MVQLPGTTPGLRANHEGDRPEERVNFGEWGEWQFAGPFDSGHEDVNASSQPGKSGNGRDVCYSAQRPQLAVEILVTPA